MRMRWLPIALRLIDTPARPCRAEPLVEGLLISCMIYSRIYLWISLSEHQKQAKTVLSPWLFTTSIHGSDQWPERKLFRSMVSMLGFLLRVRAPEKKHLAHAHWVLGALAVVNRFPLLILLITLLNMKRQGSNAFCSWTHSIGTMFIIVKWRCFVAELRNRELLLSVTERKQPFY